MAAVLSGFLFQIPSCTRLQAKFGAVCRKTESQEPVRPATETRGRCRFHIFSTQPSGSEGDSVRVLKDTDSKISIKKEALDPTNEDWRAVYNGLEYDKPASFMDDEKNLTAP
jgi:hypothetical protein